MPRVVSGETTRGIAAPAFEELDEARQVDAGPSPQEHMNVRPQDCQGHDVSVLPRGRAPEVVVQEIARTRVDHRTSLARRTGEMDVELERRHERARARLA